MPSSANQVPGKRYICWLKTLLVEVFALLALSAAVIGYLSWSSDAAWAEYSQANARPAQGLDRHAQSSIPAAKGARFCTWKA